MPQLNSRRKSPRIGPTFDEFDVNLGQSFHITIVSWIETNHICLPRAEGRGRPGGACVRIGRVEMADPLGQTAPPRVPNHNPPSTGTPLGVVGWRRGVVVSGVRRMNEVNARRGPVSIPGWVTVFGRVCIPSRYVTSQLGQLSLASLRGHFNFCNELGKWAERNPSFVYANSMIQDMNSAFS